MNAMPVQSASVVFVVNAWACSSPAHLPHSAVQEMALSTICRPVLQVIQVQVLVDVRDVGQ